MASLTTRAPDDNVTQDGRTERVAMRIASLIEKWFPDAFVFALVAVVVAAVAALAIGVHPATVATTFSTGFWDLIPFTMQMALVVVTGYVVASSPPASRAIRWLAGIPRTGRSAVAFIALIGLLTSLLNWGFGLIFAGLLAKAVSRRTDIRVDYRAAGAAAYLGMGAIWALGLSSSAAQLQANPASIPKDLITITGVIPFAQTIFLWQSLLLALVIIVVSVAVAYLTAPKGRNARTAEDLGIDISEPAPVKSTASRPGEWLECSPILTVLVAALVVFWLFDQFAHGNPILVISNLNTYNLLFLVLGMLLHGRPRNFLRAVSGAVPATAGILVQFPFYAGIAAILTSAANAHGATLAHLISQGFIHISTHATFPILIGAYSSFLGMFIPSGGGKWVIEAPYIMQASNAMHTNLGWTVQIYNAAEALPNLVNPFWMLPILGLLGLKARHVVGFTFMQFLVHLPVVLGLLWLLSFTLPYHLPTIP